MLKELKLYLKQKKRQFIVKKRVIGFKKKILKLQKEFSDILTSMGVECTLGFIDKDHTKFEF